MGTKSDEQVMAAGSIRVVNHCLICRSPILFETTQKIWGSSEQNGATLTNICRDCREKYLSLGVALVNPETDSVIVIMDEAYETIFNQPIPKGKIVRVEKTIIEQIYARLRVSQREKNQESPEGQISTN